MKKISVVFLLLFFLGCTNWDKEDKKVNQNLKPIDSLRMKAILMGDTLAFNNLRIYYLDYPPEDFIPYAIYFAEKYNYPKANYEVYLCLGMSYGQDLGEFSESTMGKNQYALALKHLKIAAKADYYDASEILKQQMQYSNGTIKDTVPHKKQH